MPATDLTLANQALTAADPDLAAQMRVTGPCRLRPRLGGRPHLESLARSIAYQQLAGRAAATIWGRFRALVAGPLTPAAILALPEEALRAAGLSGAKTAAIRDLAARAHDGRLVISRLGSLGDDDVIDRLVQVRGIGRWTAEMFLIFQLGRPDVWPVGDLAVRAGYARIHGWSEAPTPSRLEPLGERYRPWRSVAAWYCWRATDTPLPAGAVRPAAAAPR